MPSPLAIGTAPGFRGNPGGETARGAIASARKARDIRYTPKVISPSRFR